MLRLDKLSKKFGGVYALEDVSFNVEEGEVYSVIGPNGAGKTTLFNTISGLYTPTRGTIHFLGQDIASQRPDQLAKMKMSRTFQNLQVCMNMTALDNVMVGAHLQLNKNFLPAILRLPKLAKADAAAREKCKELMEFVGVGRYMNAAADGLSYGVLKRLEIARALAGDPVLLLLDEPAAGLNNTETSEVSALIRKIADSGVTILLVEHDMKMVMSISDRILVLNYGKRLSEGTPSEVALDPQVIAAYLGTTGE